ncbi:MAG: hypothetical protein A2X35_03365 [Elusimicrobia bacterium GWA2_61_42]|nr:MAG: hypothetical protein A2X35_03365 [Elusimicrobia bacterium GWA2_61_42]OGR77624.1 MAG: hypothetical protein A2X38_09605 [Elusimicrobia bacterium GWC2_61_25]
MVTMKHIVLAAFFSAFFAANSSAAWWLENDYATGSNGMKRDSLTLFTNVAPRLVAGANAAFYRNTAGYNDKVYSFRLPLMYSGDKFFVSLKPFLYPVSGQIRSGAAGAKAYLLTSLDAEDDESYLNLVLSGAWASQSARLWSGEKSKFSETAFEAQLEKSYYNQFFFQASAAGFIRPAGVSNATLRTPALDHSEMAYLGTFRPVTALPEWALSAQVARNMKPDFDSHLYAGYSKISYRNARAANSGIVGLKLGLNDKSTLDLAYNLYKDEGAAWKNYYKILLQVFF